MKNENDKFSNQNMKTTHQFRNVKKNEKMKNEAQTNEKIVKIMSFFFRICKQIFEISIMLSYFSIVRVFSRLRRFWKFSKQKFFE